MIEKRAINRIATTSSMRYAFLESPNKEFGNTVTKDISPSGAQIVLKKFFPPKSQFLVQINLEESNTIVEAIVESVWSFNKRFSDMYHSGMRFVSMTPRNRQKIEDYIKIKQVVQ